jgi:uncharacterized membrane protein
VRVSLNPRVENVVVITDGFAVPGRVVAVQGRSFRVTAVIMSGSDATTLTPIAASFVRDRVLE